MSYFVDRHEAAMQLAKKLHKYKGQNGVVLAVPRGGVPLGYVIADQLGFALDLLMTKKLGHPYNEEFAIGAVGLEDEIVEETSGISPEYIDQEVLKIRKQLKNSYKIFTGGTQPIEIAGKTVIIVDDGIATGRTVLATLQMLRRKKPKKLVVAVPVSSVDASERISKEVDELIILKTPTPFYGVGRFYRDFSPTSDEEVVSLLDKFKNRA